MTTDDKFTQPIRLGGTSITGVGMLLATVVLVLAGGFLYRERQGLQSAEIQSIELYARVLQDHAERTFNTIDIASSALADTLDADLRNPSEDRLDHDLSQSQQGLPFLRGMALITGDGRVIASSTPSNVGVIVDLKKVPLPVSGANEALGSSVSGRDLADAAAGRPAPPGMRSFIPLVRRLRNQVGEPLFLVAVLNPDFFSNEYELALADDTRAAAIVSIDGRLLAATGNVRKAPGDSLRRHRVFEEFLPQRESGSFIGAGIDGGKMFTAFRALRKRPAVVIVERGYQHAAAVFETTATWTAGIAGLALVFIGGTTVLAWRSLRGREAARLKLEATRKKVASSERDLRALVESVHELIFRTDAHGVVSFVNGRWSSLTGRPMESLIGTRLSELCRDTEREACDRLFTAGSVRVRSITVHLQAAQGRSVTLELSVSPMVNPDGTTAGFAGFAVDISEREASRQALQAQLAFTALLLEVSPTPLFVKDENGRFVTVNRAWLELMGMSLPDVLGRDSAELYGLEGPKHSEQDARLMRSGENITYENRLVLPGRPPRDTVVAKVRFTRGDGTPAGIVGSIIDVTAFREAERDIREARDAAQLANSAKSEFIANISHELRTPLQGIIGFSELGRELAAELPDFLDMFTDIHAGGQRMLTLVNGLLDISQMDGAVGSLALRRLDVARVVQEAIEQVAPRALLREQVIRVSGCEHPVDADVERVRFQQAVRNVLANAVRYAPPGSPIEVALVDGGAHGIELTVRDHGPGIPEAELESIFESFVQSSRTRDGSGGTGLGLTIARKIMSSHGGSLIAANADGGGAVLRMTLPAAGVLSDAESPLTWQDSDGLLFAPEVA